jgi:S1-C subfamily serine protease
MRFVPLAINRRSWTAWLVVVGLATGLSSASDQPKPSHDGTFRPSVVVRQRKALGTGVIIASVEGETLILTASHVVDGTESIFIEVNRFNLGLEKTRSSAGFPRKLSASLVRRDVDADLAILRIKGELAFPYVARLAPGIERPADGTEVMSIGFDKGERLIGFPTKIKTVEKIDMGHGGGSRSFLVTEDPPEVGRSGGGLFRSDGSLVGVCVARAELEKGRKLGLFATLGNVKALIKSDEEIAATLLKSTRRLRTIAR